MAETQYLGNDILQRPLPALRPWGWWRSAGYALFRMNPKLVLYRRLSRILRRPNVSIVSVVADLFWRQYQLSKYDGATIVLLEILQQLKAGGKVSDAFAKLSDQVELMLLQGGEQGTASGSGEEGRRTGLQRAFELCVKRMEDSRKAAAQVRAAFFSFALYISLSVVALIIFADFVVPAIAAIYPTERWTGIPYSVYVISLFVKSTAFAVIVALLTAGIIVYPFLLPRWRGKLRTFMDRFPPFSFYRLQVGGGWLMSIPALTESRQFKAYDALVSTAGLAQPWLRERIVRITREMESGKKLGDAMLATGMNFPDKELIYDIRLYENNGMDTDTVLRELASEWGDTGIDAIKRQAKRMEQVASISFMAIITWFTVATVLLQVDMSNYFVSVIH